MNPRYNIGLLVAKITDPFSNAVSIGAMKASKETGANLTIFPGKYVDIKHLEFYDNTYYEYQYNTLFSYAAEADFDYLIIALGTICYALDDAKKLAFLEKFKGKPSLILATKLPGYADMDDLKKVNDNYGHIEGDEAIRNVAACLRHVFGEDAIVGRMGGDEFAVLKDLSNELSGTLTAESIRALRDGFIESINSSGDKPYHFGVSLGIIFADLENSYDLKTAIDKADSLMYAEKTEKKAHR